MDAVQGVQGRRKLAVRDALHLCDELIALVEKAQLGTVSADARFVYNFMDAAMKLIQWLDTLGISVSGDLQGFDGRYRRDGSHPARQTITEFALPVHEEGWLLTGLVNADVPEWLRLMREFRDEIAATHPRSNRPKPQSKGGRPASKKTLQIRADVQQFFDEERHVLQKNGLPPADVLVRLQSYSCRKILTDINERYRRTLPLDDCHRKKVARTPAWETIHSAESITASIDSEDNAEDSAGTRNGKWAAANGLSTSSRPVQRTKLRPE
jgi:hypothetical protein